MPWLATFNYVFMEYNRVQTMKLSIPLALSPGAPPTGHSNPPKVRKIARESGPFTVKKFN